MDEEKVNKLSLDLSMPCYNEEDFFLLPNRTSRSSEKLDYSGYDRKS